jgi:1-aminocyclopropane-1-carboxylate deaminase
MQNLRIQTLPSLSFNDVETSILRLDEWHPVVSGNKWFKLRYYLEEAIAGNVEAIATFGGAYSNHLVATAFAVRQAGLKSIGYVRAEMNEDLSPTLLQCRAYGMELRPIGRAAYAARKELMEEGGEGIYWIPEGGYGSLGAKGAATILDLADTFFFTHIVCAVGSGTMMAGLVSGAAKHQRVTGISALKGNLSLEREIRAILTTEAQARSFELLHDYHFGGFAKHPAPLIDYMKQLWHRENLPTDLVYTAKMLFAAQDLVDKRHFPAGSRVLLIHSGGLQGNRSLPAGTLPF